MTDSRSIDLDRVLDALRRRVLTDGERVVRVPPRPEPTLIIRTERRRFQVGRQPWLIRREPWVDDAVLVIGSPDGPLHEGTPVWGFVFARDGGEYLLADGVDDLAALGPRLPAGLDPIAFAQLLPFFHTRRWGHGTLYRDHAELVEQFPEAAELAGLRSPTWERAADGGLSLTLHSFARTGSEPQWYVEFLEWTVIAPPDRPASWSRREIALVELA